MQHPIEWTHVQILSLPISVYMYISNMPRLNLTQHLRILILANFSMIFTIIHRIPEFISQNYFRNITNKLSVRCIRSKHKTYQTKILIRRNSCLSSRQIDEGTTLIVVVDRSSKCYCPNAIAGRQTENRNDHFIVRYNSANGGKQLVCL